MTVIYSRSSLKSMTGLERNLIQAIKSNQLQDLVLKESLFTSKPNPNQNKIPGEIYIWCELAKLILFFLPSSQLGRWAKLYLSNTELAVFSRNPSIFIWKKKW